MKRGIATVTMTGTLPEKLRAARSAGFGGIELCKPIPEKHRQGILPPWRWIGACK